MTNQSKSSRAANSKKASTRARVTKKARLTEKEKKANHIASESNRRGELRKGYERLAVLVGKPGEGRKEAAILQTVCEVLGRELKRKEQLKERAMGMGMSEAEFEKSYDSKLRAIEDRPKGTFTLQGGTVVSNEDASSPASGSRSGRSSQGGEGEEEEEEEEGRSDTMSRDGGAGFGGVEGGNAEYAPVAPHYGNEGGAANDDNPDLRIDPSLQDHGVGGGPHFDEDTNNNNGKGQQLPHRGPGPTHDGRGV